MPIIPFQKGFISSIIQPLVSLPGTAKLQRTSTLPIQRGIITKILKPFASFPCLPKKYL